MHQTNSLARLVVESEHESRFKKSSAPLTVLLTSNVAVDALPSARGLAIVFSCRLA